jgi:hypothetical protein
MFTWLFKSRIRQNFDESELRGLRSRYGDRLLDVLKGRIKQRGLSGRDRRHWKRLLRLAR